MILPWPNCLIQIKIDLLEIEIKYIGGVDLCLNFERKLQPRIIHFAKTKLNEIVMPRLMLTDELWSKLKVL